MRDDNKFLKFAAPGHFYSPLPDPAFIEARRGEIFSRREPPLPGLDLNVAGQLATLAEIGAFAGDAPFAAEARPGLRFYFDNVYFSYGDALVLYGMMRARRPRRIIEVGSGFSSAVMLDTNDRFLDRSVTCTFIDPYPERLQALLNDDDRARHRIVEGIVQDVPLATFDQLQRDDILFIDSSHVVKVASDVVLLVTEVLPRLQPGVVIHVHDIFWPFEYPEQWVMEGRAWTEGYLLKAFLQFNTAFEIVIFNSYLATHHRDAIERHLPLMLRNTGGSLWLRKVA